VVAGYAALRVAHDVARIRGAFRQEIAPRVRVRVPGVRYDQAPDLA
jgi:hypothetical protein